jgi:hypothetical protein
MYGSNISNRFESMWTIIKKIAGDPKAGKIIFLLDALDECEESGRLELVDKLVDFYGNVTGGGGKNTALKFLVTSRPYSEIERPFKKLTSKTPTIRLAGDEETESIRREIDLVIRARVQEIGSMLELDDSVRSSLENALLSIEHRTYLWLKLIFDVISSRLDVTKKRLLETIGKIPKTVEEAYVAILEKSTDLQRAKKLLHIVVAAARPLTLREMNVALSIEEGSRSYAKLDLEPLESFKVTVRNLCGLFVRVIDLKIYLIHQTAKEFLVRENNGIQAACRVDSCLESWRHPIELRGSNLVLSKNCIKHSLEPAESNLVLAKICISYLRFDIFESNPLVIGDVSGRDIKEKIDRYTRKHDFLDYSAKNWATHFQGAKIKEEAAEFKPTLEICDTRSKRKRFMTWFQVYWSTVSSSFRCPQKFTDLMVGSYFGCEAVVRFLLKQGADLEAEAELGETAWQIESSLEGRMTALHWAVRNGHEAVVVLLLENRARINLKTKLEGTPVQIKSLLANEGFVP